jgi:hypothetical protein
VYYTPGTLKTVSTDHQAALLLAAAGLAGVAGLTAGASALNARPGAVRGARAALALVAGAALFAGVGFVLASTEPPFRGSDCSGYVEHGTLPVGLLFAAVAVATAAFTAIARIGRTMARAALAIGSGEIVLFMLGMLYISSANPSC